MIDQEHARRELAIRRSFIQSDRLVRFAVPLLIALAVALLTGLLMLNTLIVHVSTLTQIEGGLGLLSLICVASVFGLLAYVRGKDYYRGR